MTGAPGPRSRTARLARSRGECGVSTSSATKRPNATGSLIVSGRYHKGHDDFPPDESFPVLYTSLSPETCLAELVRHTVAETLPYLNGYRLTEIEATLGTVADCTDPESLGVMIHDLTSSASLRVTRAIGEAAHAAGYEAIRVPSASHLGDNLIIFPRNLRNTSSLTVVGSRDPRLRVEPPDG